METIPSLLLAAFLLAANGSLTLRIVETDASGKEIAVAARVHLVGPDGKPVKTARSIHPGTGAGRPAPFFHDHLACDGVLAVALPANVAGGVYRYAVERGPEYRRASGSVTVAAGVPTEARIVLVRWIDLPRRGWWSGDLHVHRPPEDMATILRAEDLHVAPLLTVWNDGNLWRGRPAPADPVVEVEPGRAYHLLASEYERGGGALLFFNLTEPLDVSGTGQEHPSPFRYLAEAAARPGAWIEVEKPFWWDAPSWVATGKVRSIGILNNHVHRDGVLDAEAWGRPRDRDRFPAPRGNGLYSQEIYYRLLNCGFRLVPTAGSASGVLPNPVGHNRAYAHIDGPFRHDAWWRALEAGRCFVTNGPILLADADGRLPGETFLGGESVELGLDVRVDGNDPIESVEVVRDGEIVERIEAGGWLRPRPLRFERSGWFLVRAFARAEGTLRFASTAPFWVEVGGKPTTIHRGDVEFFLGWVDERVRNLEASPHLKSDEERESVVRPHREARAVFERLLRAIE